MLIYNRVEKYFRRIVLGHIMTILIAVFSYGYRGKTTQMSAVSEKHRTTIAHFLTLQRTSCLRWSTEVFFRQAKQKLALDKYQIRASTGIRRFWLFDVAGSLYLLLWNWLFCPLAGWLGGISLCFAEGAHYLHLSVRGRSAVVRLSAGSRCLVLCIPTVLLIYL